MKTIAATSMLFFFAGVGSVAAEDSASPSPESQSDSSASAPFTPYFFDDFETYTDGVSLSAGKPFGAAGRTVASSEKRCTWRSITNPSTPAARGGSAYGGITN